MFSLRNLYVGYTAIPVIIMMAVYILVPKRTLLHEALEEETVDTESEADDDLEDQPDETTRLIEPARNLTVQNYSIWKQFRSFEFW